ncbi:hypothetical protein Tco_0618400 [Tanacetum coccineum]
MLAGSEGTSTKLATGLYAQNAITVLRYINTKPNSDALRKCILKRPGRGDEIYSTVDRMSNSSRNVEKPSKATTVNELRAERMAKNANPLTLVATAQTLQDPYAPTSKLLPQDLSQLQDTKAKSGPIVQQSGILLTARNLVIMLRNAESQNGLKTSHTDEEIDEQELEAHYSYNAKIQKVPNADSGTDAEPLEQVQYDTDDNVFTNDIQHFDQSESTSNTCTVETNDSNITHDSPDMCDNDFQDDQNDVECDDERVALANLIANLKLDVDENKKIKSKAITENKCTLTSRV